MDENENQMKDAALNDEKKSESSEAPENAISAKKAFPLKRIIISALAGLLAFALFWGAYFLLRAAPDPAAAEYAGEYVLGSAQSGDITLEEAENPDILSLRLESSGKCMVCTAGGSYSGRWTLNDGVFSVRCGTVRLSGSISGSVLRLENIMGSGLDAELTRSAAPSESAGPAALSGKYTLTGVESDGSTYSYPTIEAAGYSGSYIAFSKNGTGKALLFDGETQQISCGEGFIIYKGMRLGCTSDNGLLRIEYPGGVTLIFEKS